MAAESDGSEISRDTFTLNELTESFDLPQWVEVVGGEEASLEGKGSCNIRKGMILMLRTLAVDNVTLSFNDTDTGIKRLVQVSPDSQVKFKVLLPYPDFKNPKGERTIYKTVADLFTVCPTYFKANIAYDDPYLPAIVKSGEIFRFIRKIVDPVDRLTYMQCEDPDGNIVRLPSECQGDFTAEEDERSYSLSEILELGVVDRKLRLANEAMSMVADDPETEHVYGNLSHSDGSSILHRIMGLPLTYTGMVTFHKPKMFLAASPSDDIQNVMKMPLDLKINVKQFQVDDYERPVHGKENDNQRVSQICKMYQLSELLDTFHEDFPVLATLVRYKDIPSEFVHCVCPGEDLVVHSIERYERILAKSGDTYFSIAKEYNGRFRRSLKQFQSIQDVLTQYADSTEELQAKVLQDVASDFPIVFSLQTGDVLKFKKFHTKMHKVKLKSKNYGSFPVLSCEKRTGKGQFEKVLLPEDLEVALHELPNSSKVGGFTISEVFRYKPEMPMKVDFLADYHSLWSCLPITAEIEFTHFITEAFAVISPIQRSDDDEYHLINPTVRDCLLIPARHQMFLTMKDCLGFPTGYFKFPDKGVHIFPALEKIGKQSYEELVRHNDMAYEDYSPESPQDGTLVPTRARRSKHGSDSAIDHMNKRLSKSFTLMFNKTKDNSTMLFHKLRRKKSSNDDVDSGGNPNAVQNLVYQAASEGSDMYDDENIYEHVEPKK